MLQHLKKLPCPYSARKYSDVHAFSRLLRVPFLLPARAWLLLVDKGSRGRSRRVKGRLISYISTIMPSPRHSPKSIRERRAYDSRLEFLSLTDQRGPVSPENMSHHKDSSTSTGPQQALPEEDCMKLNPSFWGIALHSLLAVDLWASKLLGICAGENSPWGSVRPLMIVIEVSGHGIPWLTGTLYGLYRSSSSAGREVLLNLLFAEQSEDSEC